MYKVGEKYTNIDTKELVTIENILPSQLLVSYKECHIAKDFTKQYRKRYELYNYMGTVVERLAAIPDEAA